uniref:Uncharacterized protein n=1 Tax=Glypta fumiferanae TaxID=389681 RepID=A0A0F6QA63_9HYME|nr:hypothetical protein [Glypta fumiferanae]
MNWIMINVVTDALRRVGVESLNGRSDNIDGNGFKIMIARAEQRKLFIQYCNESIPALNLNYDEIVKFDETKNPFIFRLVTRSERMNLLAMYVDVLPIRTYELLVARPVYTFITIYPNLIIDAFMMTAEKTGLYSIQNLLRVVSIKGENENVNDKNSFDTSSALILTGITFAILANKLLSS